ncbi:unnamed protein product [Auanema sp. JU1783]|nr:unnamed protein product [Auanema sp. JU1783]
MSLTRAFIISLFIQIIYTFNIDIHSPLNKFGPENSYFGYSVAQHYSRDKSVILVGAPRAQSRQVGTTQAGAIYSCPINTHSKKGGKEWCSLVNAEYEEESGYSKTPDMTSVQGKQFHYLGKDGQLLGAVVASQAVKGGNAVVCSPLTRFHNMSGYVQGACYELDTDLRMKTLYSTCMQKNVPKSLRHNEFGGCMEGISATITNNTIITGVIGALKWTGGVFAKWSEGDPFGDSKEKYTMASGDREGIRSMLTSHDYLGYSVNVGRFGFWYEDPSRKGSQTIVSGATRSGQHGAVLFLPFNNEDHSDTLGPVEDHFVLNGTKMGSAFGYSTAVLDINNDGFDDLVVSAPFEHRSDTDGHFGGIVYVYFSQGIQRAKSESHLVFHPPVVLKGPPHFSQFGLAITKLGNLDGDKNGYQDFAVGAPYSNDGSGSVYIFLGAKSPKKMRRKPAQIIDGSQLPNMGEEPIRSFGFSLSGGMDVDNNGYPDLVVGSVLQNSITVLRSRPVISIVASHKTESEYVDIEKGSNCPRGSKTCFPLKLEIFVDAESKRGADLIDFSADVFTCNLEVIPTSKQFRTRALIEGNHSTNMSWPCGKGAHNNKRVYRETIYIPDDDVSKDWINPLKFRFTVRIMNERTPPQAIEGRPVTDLRQYPILNKYGASYEFQIPFNTRCGDDHVCNSDLSLRAVFAGIPKTEKGYVMNVGNRDHLDISVTVENKGEKAYQAAMYLKFDPEELELPTVVGSKKLTFETVGKNYVVVHLGNPMDGKAKHQFDIRLKLVRGRTEGIGRPLVFSALVNSTSVDTNKEDNEWTTEVQIIKQAELELIGISEPSFVLYGGQNNGAIELEEDIGFMIRHNYTVHNLGPWTVRNVRAEFQWPYQIASEGSKKKWGLYLLDVPTVTMHNTDGTTEIRRCSVERKLEYINPMDIKLNTKYTSQETIPARQDKHDKRAKRDAGSVVENTLATASFGRDRVEPKKRFESGYDIDVVTISCVDNTAKCFNVVCHFDFIDANSAPVIDFRARLWNSSFVDDYYDVAYVEVVSSGKIILDSTEGIEDDPSNNIAYIKTIAYPDRPAIGVVIPLWIILASVAAGLFILLLFVLCLWKCGFFKRKRVGEPSLHRAQLTHEREQWAQSRM